MQGVSTIFTPFLTAFLAPALCRWISGTSNEKKGQRGERVTIICAKHQNNCKKQAASNFCKCQLSSSKARHRAHNCHMLEQCRKAGRSCPQLVQFQIWEICDLRAIEPIPGTSLIQPKNLSLHKRSSQNESLQLPSPPPNLLACHHHLQRHQNSANKSVSQDPWREENVSF